MSKGLRVVSAASIPIAAFLWARATAVAGSPATIARYGIAGAIAGFGLMYIGREFASLPFSRYLSAWSAVFGFAILTPIIAMLFQNSTDPTDSSKVVVAAAAAGAAALAGASWGVISLAGDAFSEWRSEKTKSAPPLNFKGVPR
jgi:hypothetical protein